MVPFQVAVDSVARHRATARSIHPTRSMVTPTHAWRVT